MPRRGVLRLVVLALTLAGFAAMHALGSVAGDGTHCGAAPALIMMADAHSGTEESAAHAAVSAAHDGSVRVDTTMPGHSSDDVATGCLLALFGALALIGLRLLRRFGTDTTSPHVRPASVWLHGA